MIMEELGLSPSDFVFNSNNTTGKDDNCLSHVKSLECITTLDGVIARKHIEIDFSFV